MTDKVTKTSPFGGNDFNETRAEKLPTSPGLVSPDQVHFPRSGNQAWVIVW